MTSESLNIFHQEFRKRQNKRHHICMHMSELLNRVRLFVTPGTAAHQAPLSMGFSRQEYWNGLPCPPLGDLPDPGIKQGLLHCRQILYQLSYQGSPKN